MLGWPVGVTLEVLIVFVSSSITVESIHRNSKDGAAENSGQISTVEMNHEAVLTSMGLHEEHSKPAAASSGSPLVRREENVQAEHSSAASLLAGNQTWKADCKWSAWSGWTPPSCPKSCGVGVQKKTRYKTQEAMNGGRPCDDDFLNEVTVACDTDLCPIHCAWTGWGAWTPCTASCGGGTQQRIRTQGQTAEHGGRPCTGNYKNNQGCNTHACPIDCELKEWTEWSNCTEECGGGERTRSKIILIPPQHGGQECGPIEENGTCNEDACPIKAGASGFGEVSVIVTFLLIVTSLRMTPTSQDTG